MNFFGPIVPVICQSCACGWGGFFQVIQNVLSIGITLSIVLAVLLFAYAGFLLVTNPASPENISSAKGVALNAVIGLVVVLGAWLIVNTVMNALYNGSFGPWSSIISNTPAACLSFSPPPAPVTSGSSVAGSPGTGTGGSCQILPSGPCSVASLSQTCFANRVNDASAICNIESAGGQTNIESGSDKLNGGTGPSYSVGLWQINLTTSQIGGLNCPAAFTGPCQGSNLVGSSNPGACTASIKNDRASNDLYQSCLTAAKDAANNTAVACKLYGSGTFAPWAYSANRCSISKSGG
jgi:hypothetical protein